MFKQGDIVKRKESMWDGISAYTLEPFDKFEVTAYYNECKFPLVCFKESGSYQWDAAYFEIAEEDKVKNRFAVGDKVISIKNTPDSEEGFIGFIVQACDVDYDWEVKPLDGGLTKAFNEDELELLSVGGKDHPFNRDDITPQDIAGVSKSALDKQVGGGHYKEKGIQPIEYIFANNLGFCEANIVKYATRWKDKNGIQDLEKIIHYAELLIELTKKEEVKNNGSS